MEVKAIDYAVPMVFHDDPEWRKGFMEAGHRYDENNLTDFVRYRSWGTEELLMRCVLKFMPWLRNIYIILAQESQKRDWMDKLSPKVRIVYHRDFMPQWALPTFNSCAIEMFLYRIPGISDRFLYGNDDMFPLVPLTDEEFFDGNIPCLHHTEKEFPSNPNIFHMSCRNGLNFVAKEFGKRYITTWLKGGHSITPMLKNTWEHLWDIGKGDIEVSITRFRDSRNFNQWICPWWHHLSGQYTDRTPKRSYVSTRNSVNDVARIMSAKDAGIVCVNDNECERDYMRYGRAVVEQLKARLQ